MWLLRRRVGIVEWIPFPKPARGHGAHFVPVVTKGAAFGARGNFILQDLTPLWNNPIIRVNQI